MLTQRYAKLLTFVIAIAGYTNIHAQTIYTISGTGLRGYSGDGGPGIAAQLSTPSDVKSDSHGNVYIADRDNQVVRKINAAGIISTIAGNGDPNFYGDNGPATSAMLHNPSGVAVDKAGNVYIADAANNVVRKVDTAGIITTYAGKPGENGYSGNGGVATSAKLDGPTNLAIDVDDNLYITDRNNNVIRMVTPGHIISTAAGNSVQGYNGDGSPGPAAELNQPRGIWVDSSRNLYIADFGNDVVRKVDGLTKNISTIAGTNMPGNGRNGSAATATSIHGPTGVTADDFGNVYFSEYHNDVVRKITTDGKLHAFAGNGNGGFSGDSHPATAAEINYPGAMSVDGVGNVYFPDINNNVIRRVHVAPLASQPVTAIAQMQVYPNPARDILNISNITQATKYTICNYMGMVVAEGTLTQGNQSVSIKAMQPGLYNMKLYQGGVLLQTEKVVKQ